MYLKKGKNKNVQINNSLFSTYVLSSMYTKYNDKFIKIQKY